MTVREVIDRTDMLYPNSFPFKIKADWLNELDKRIYAELLDFYRSGEKVTRKKYFEHPDTVLLVGDEFAEMYVAFLVMQFDTVNADSIRYANSAAIFNSLYLSFMNTYNRTHTSPQTSIIIN